MNECLLQSAGAKDAWKGNSLTLAGVTVEGFVKGLTV